MYYICKVIIYTDKQFNILENPDDLLSELKKLAADLNITLTEMMLTPRLLNIIFKIIQEKRNKS